MLNTEVRRLPGYGFAHRSRKYHLHEFVYIMDDRESPTLTWENASNFVYRIGQIQRIHITQEVKTVELRFFPRYDDFVRVKHTTSLLPKLLSPTDEVRLLS